MFLIKIGYYDSESFSFHLSCYIEKFVKCDTTYGEV